MFRVNRLRITVNTAAGEFGFDEKFDKRINFIASYENTKGKSSCIEAIYYCLGLEELIGGKKEKTLKPVFRKSVEYQQEEIAVLESNFYLEIQNKNLEIITVYRTANKQNFDSSLVTVFFGDMNKLDRGIVRSEDMYLHSKGSATSNKGFHMYLERFLGWELPEVPTYDGIDRKLYLQIVFAGIFIEQKRGWADLFATLPTYLKIKEPQKRIVEFIIGLDSLTNEKLRQDHKTSEMELKSGWTKSYNNIVNTLKKVRCKIYGLPNSPTILDENYHDKVSIFRTHNSDEEVPLSEYILELNKNIENINRKEVKVGDNIEDLQEELLSLNEKISDLQKEVYDKNNELVYEKGSVQSLIHSLEIINKDILNNKDTLKLKKLGSSEEWLINKNLCPTCHQKIHDSLLPQDIHYEFMSIDENINHLDAQKKMMEFAIKSHKLNISNIEDTINWLEKKLMNFRSIAHSINNDIYCNDENLSETVIRKKLSLEIEIDLLDEIEKDCKKDIIAFKELSNQWRDLIAKKKKFPDEEFTANDRVMIKKLRDYFTLNLQDFGYSSIVDKSTIQISDIKLLPTTEGFDMKFDSSASDNIRAIWAYTLALMQVSNKFSGNHPNLLIFDEPDQQSIIANDMKNFFQTIVSFEFDCQVIIGITMKDEETRKIISDLDEDDYRLILLEDKAIHPRKNAKRWDVMKKINDPNDDAEVQGILQAEIYENTPEEIYRFMVEDIVDTYIENVTSNSIQGTCTIEALDEEGDDFTFDARYEIEFDSEDENVITNIEINLIFD